MTVLVDTSVLLALLDADDEHRDDAVRRWQGLAEAGAPLLTSNYVVLEVLRSLCGSSFLV